MLAIAQRIPVWRKRDVRYTTCPTFVSTQALAAGRITVYDFRRLRCAIWDNTRFKQLTDISCPYIMLLNRNWYKIASNMNITQVFAKDYQLRCQANKCR